MPPKNDAKPEPEQTEDNPSSEKKGIPKLYILLGFVALILFQTILLTFMLPGSPKLPADGGQPGIEYNPDSPNVRTVDPTIDPAVLKPDEIEVKIGDSFEVATPSPKSVDKTDIYTVQFYARIKKDEESKFTPLYEQNAQTIRYEIRTVLNKAELADKQDPNQTKIRHQVEVKINDILGKAYIKRIITPEYKFDTI
jgi:hypothetical protein